MPSVYCFVFVYLISFVIVLEGQDWFLVWLGLEINMMSFLMLIYRRYDVGVIESCMSYFFIQSVGSAIFIGMFYVSMCFLSGVLILILSYKIGAGPFFYWFPSMCMGIDWVSCYILMLFQKIIPLLLASLFVHWVMWVVIMLSLIMGVLGSFNQVNIKSLMAYSSIHHLGWIFMIMMSLNLSWVLYLFVYGLVLLSVVMLLISDEIVNLSLVYLSSMKLVFMMSMLSMAGMPPLLGFFLKWMALMNVVSMNILLLFMLVLVSVVMLYVYMRIVYDVFMGGEVEWNFNYEMLVVNSNMEVLSVVGVFVGIILGFYMIM
nr:NADH dehydrogenase subunit 2 [Corythalia opima]